MRVDHDAAAVLTADERLRSLLSANRLIVSELSLPAVLRRIVEAARTVAGARYAALGVVGRDGKLEQFVHAGVDDTTAAAIGDLPCGRGVLGVLITHPEPVRLHRITDDPRFFGFPKHHPPMTTFLGVPIRVRDAIFGNLYLSDRSDGADFSAEDEDLVSALAATAGVAVENARLYEESRRRQEWLRASGEISRDLLAPDQDEDDVLRRIATCVQRLADADVVAILVPYEGRTGDPPGHPPDPPTDRLSGRPSGRPAARPEDDYAGEGAPELEVVAASGERSAELRLQRQTGSGSLAWQAMQTGRGVQVGPGEHAEGVLMDAHVPVGPVMALPLTGQRRPLGAVMLGRHEGRPPFTASDLQMAEAFASQAALALELADARTDQQRLSVLEDRDRIARDLHDHVIQRLFAIGLGVQSLASTLGETGPRRRLERTVDELDETIRQIRTSIYALRENRVTARTVRDVAMELVAEMEGVLGLRPEVAFSGPLDALVDDRLVDDVEAVLREALTNVAKHARAQTVSVLVSVDDGQLAVQVLDDGIGLNPSAQHSGLANLRFRAHQHGGDLAVANRAEGGLRVQWSIPLTI